MKKFLEVKLNLKWGLGSATRQYFKDLRKPLSAKKHCKSLIIMIHNYCKRIILFMGPSVRNVVASIRKPLKIHSNNKLDSIFPYVISF